MGIGIRSIENLTLKISSVESMNILDVEIFISSPTSTIIVWLNAHKATSLLRLKASETNE